MLQAVFFIQATTRSCSAAMAWISETKALQYQADPPRTMRFEKALHFSPLVKSKQQLELNVLRRVLFIVAILHSRETP